MSRWIEVESVIADLDHGLWGRDWDKALAEAIIRDAPSIDIVRCKECKHYESDGGAMMICNITDMVGDDDDYCSYGVRKTEPQTENPCDGCVCDDGKHLMYCMNCKGIAWKTEPPKDEPQTDEEWYTFRDEQEYSDRWERSDT